MVLSIESISNLHVGQTCYVRACNWSIPEKAKYLGVCGKYDSLNIYRFMSLKTKELIESYCVFVYTKQEDEPIYRVEYMEPWGEWFPMSASITIGRAKRLIKRMHRENSRPLRIWNNEAGKIAG